MNRQFSEPAERHREALASFLATARAVPDDRWIVPRGEGKWSPAQVAEHLALTYEILLREMNTGTGMAIRTTWWQRVVLRLTMLPKIMRTGRFPSGAIAPREVRPAAAQPKDALLERLAARGDEFEKRIIAFSADPAARLTHAYFGRVKPGGVLRFCSIHIAHHHKQL